MTTRVIGRQQPWLSLSIALRSERTIHREPRPRCENGMNESIATLFRMVHEIPAGYRTELVMAAVANVGPGKQCEDTCKIQILRALISECWQLRFRGKVPMVALSEAIKPPVRMYWFTKFSALGDGRDLESFEKALEALFTAMRVVVQQQHVPKQKTLFDLPVKSKSIEAEAATGQVVSNLNVLVDQGLRFPTIYADPPWPYSNQASRAAAANHYDTMDLADIASLPIPKLADENCHFHLWTTNAFLRESIDLLEEWGFTYKSCLVWVKPRLGMGNYWRVSHEFLMLGVRGNRTFRDRTVPSWLLAERSVHSRKPREFRELVERVSEGPYLELFGREAFPFSAWTVFGDQIESQLF